MSGYDKPENEEIYAKVIRAGRRTYFFDVRSTKADDYYITITESKKFTNDDGSFFYRKHKIYLYKEDFENFQNALAEATDFVINEKGEEVISERHQTNYIPENEAALVEETSASKNDKYTDLRFEDI